MHFIPIACCETQSHYCTDGLPTIFMCSSLPLPLPPSLSFSLPASALFSLSVSMCVSMNMYVFGVHVSSCVYLRVSAAFAFVWCVCLCGSCSATVSPLTCPQCWLSNLERVPSALFSKLSQGVKQERITAEVGSMLSGLAQDKENVEMLV